MHFFFFIINMYTDSQANLILPFWLEAMHKHQSLSVGPGMGWRWGWDLALSDDKPSVPGCLRKAAEPRMQRLGGWCEAARQPANLTQGFVSPRVKLCCQTHPNPCNRQAALGTLQSCDMGWS